MKRVVSLTALLFALAASTSAHASAPHFASPVFVDRALAGGEPTVAYAVRSGLLVYTSHEGTTHLFTSGVPGAPAESGGFISNYHNQVNIWTSSNNGLTWTLVPFGSATNPFATGFSDPDLTQDANGNIYNTGIDLANDALFSSQDGGRHWLTGTAQCHEGDRPWLAGAGRNEVFLSTDTEEAGHEVFHSTDAGASCAANGIADNGTAGGQSYTGTGKLYFDRRRGQLIEPVYYSNSSGVVDGVGVGILHNASSAFSATPAPTFNDVKIANTTSFSHWPSLAIDSAGNYYMVWDTDARDPLSHNGCPPTDSGSESFGSLPPTNATTPLANAVMMVYSTDGGAHWSTPRAVASFQGHRLLWPWITAGNAGRVGVVWYQYDRVVDPDCAPSDAQVSVMAEELSAADSPHPALGGPVDAIGRPIHSRSICAGGTTCAADNVITGEDRRLGDYFTDAIDNRGCLMIATGDTTLVDAVTGGESPISHPLFVHQNGGTGLFGLACGGVARTHRHHHRQQRAHRRARHRRRQPNFTA